MKQLNSILCLKNNFQYSHLSWLSFFNAPKCLRTRKTKAELKAEREVFKTEMKSKDAEERKAKFEKLKPPKKSGVGSVDQLAANSTKNADIN